MDDKLEKDEILDMIPLDTSTQQIADEIIKETDTKKLKDLTYLFNLNLTKKNVLRVLKLNTLLDKVSDQMLERFEKKPGEFSNITLFSLSVSFKIPNCSDFCNIAFTASAILVLDSLLKLSVTLIFTWFNVIAGFSSIRFIDLFALSIAF